MSFEPNEIVNLFAIGEVAIINEHVSRDLPNRIGQRATILRTSTFSNFELDVECDDGEVLPLKASELNKLTEEDKQYMDFIFTNNEVVFDGKKVRIVKVNYLTRQAEVKENNGVEYIVEFKDLDPLHIDSVEELKFDIYEDLLNKFFDHYKNKDDSYTIPKELLINLLKGLYAE